MIIRRRGFLKVCGALLGLSVVDPIEVVSYISRLSVPSIHVATYPYWQGKEPFNLLNVYDEILRTFYLPVIKEQLEQSSSLLDIFESCESNKPGPSIRIPLHYETTQKGW